MVALFSNNAYSTLASSITDADVSLTVTATEGARFPSPTGADYFYATLIDTANNLEIVKCTARSTDTLTITRAQESTTANAYAAGDRIEVRVTAAGLTDVIDQAATFAAAAAAAYDDFDDRYLGPKASAPTLDNDGDALIDGAMYFNTTTPDMWVYDLTNTVWVTVSSLATSVAAAASASAASTSETNASASAAAAAASAAEGLYRDVIVVNFAASPYTILSANDGDFFKVDTSGGAVTINLPDLSGETDDFRCAIMKETADANAVTINRQGTDTINGATSATITTQYQTTNFIGDQSTLEWSATDATAGTALIATQNLADLDNAATARTNLGVEIGTDVLAPDGDSAALSGATLTAKGVVEKSTSAENVAGTEADKYPDVPGVKEMIDTHVSSGITLGTPVATTSGTVIDKTGIPAGAQRIKFMIDALSTNGTSKLIIQLGDSGGFETTGYVGALADNSAGTVSQLSDGFLVSGTVVATNQQQGVLVLELLDSSTNTWIGAGLFGKHTANSSQVAGSKSLSGTLTQIRLTTQGGSDTFDNGKANISYE